MENILGLSIIEIILIIAVGNCLVFFLLNKKELKETDKVVSVMVDRMLDVWGRLEIIEKFYRTDDLKHGLYRSREDKDDYVILFDTRVDTNDETGEEFKINTIVGIYHRKQSETGGLEWLPLEEFQKRYVPT